MKLESPSDRLRLAAVAFASHHIGVRFLYGLRLSKPMFRINLAALGATLVVTAVVAAYSSSAVWSFVAFTTGHFVWSTMYATAILKWPEATFETRR